MTNKRGSNGDPQEALGTMFKRLGGLLNILSDLAEKGQELHKSGEIKSDDKGVRAVYGFSVRMGGGGGGPSIQPFGNVRDGRQGPVVEETREPLVDIFDEGEHVLVVAELPGVTAQDVKFEAQDDILSLSASRGDRKYKKEILLPFAVSAEGAAPSFQNGVFELRLQRAR